MVSRVTGMDKINYTITCNNYDIIVYEYYEILLKKHNQITVFLN